MRSDKIVARTMVGALALLVFTACPSSSENRDDSQRTIRVSGSDTMVNLAGAWAENYDKRHPEIAVTVAGGGSGVGIANLIDGMVDIANSSRKMKAKEIARTKQKNGVEPVEFVVGLDALGVYVHNSNPLDEISTEELGEIYGEGGKIEKWSQVGIDHQTCETDDIIRVSRQNSSGTYYYFREAVVGEGRELGLGSIDLSGSKEVVELVSRTPCAIGYSGMGYATPEVKMLAISQRKGGNAVKASAENATSGDYPITRPLYLYTSGPPEGAVKDFIDWILSDEGQDIVAQIRYVPIQGAQH